MEFKVREPELDNRLELSLHTDSMGYPAVAVVVDGNFYDLITFRENRICTEPEVKQALENEGLDVSDLPWSEDGSIKIDTEYQDEDQEENEE